MGMVQAMAKDGDKPLCLAKLQLGVTKMGSKWEWCKLWQKMERDHRVWPDCDLVSQRCGLELMQAMVRELVTMILSGQTVTSCDQDGVKVVPGDDASCCQKMGGNHHALLLVALLETTTNFVCTMVMQVWFKQFEGYLQWQQKEKWTVSLSGQEGDGQFLLASHSIKHF